jgi:hypothetical protein
MLIVKWNVTLKKGDIDTTNVLITTTAFTIQEARVKMNDLIDDFLKEGWELHFTSIKEIVSEEQKPRGV